MRDLILLFVHLLTRLIRLAGPGGVRSVIAESILYKLTLDGKILGMLGESGRGPKQFNWPHGSRVLLKTWYSSRI